MNKYFIYESVTHSSEWLAHPMLQQPNRVKLLRWVWDPVGFLSSRNACLPFFFF